MVDYVGSKVLECTAPQLQVAFQCMAQATIRKITYMTQYHDSVRELQDKQPTASWVQAEADKANNKGEDVNSSEVKKWREQEKPLIDEAKRVISEFDQLNEKNGFTCCLFMPNLWRRYRIGRKARKCTQNIDEFRKSKFMEFTGDETPQGEVTDDSWLNSVKPKTCELQSRVTVINEILRVLADDRIQHVGIWGPEGGGKTTLMYQLLNLVDKQKLLHHRVQVQVPKEDGEKGIEAQIQAQIVKKFCPSILNKCEEFNDRAEHLRKWFNHNTEKKAVIILDGLWRKINLDMIGIPNNEVKICHVILTARDMDLLVNDMGLSRERTFPVEPLSLEESKKLFLYIVRRSGQTIDEEKKSVAGDLVKYCGGLPKLIKQEASILTNQRDIYAWHDALREIKFQNVEKMLKPVEETLSSSSSNENDRKEIRSLFKLCGLFGESSILVRDLIIHCKALGIFTQDATVKETNDRVKRLLHILRARSLIGGDNHEVTITELFREVAVHIASKENYLFIRNDSSYKRSEFEKWTVDQLKVCIALSIDGLDILKDHPELEYHNLKMLQLGSKHRFLKIGVNEFFNHMKELEGLHLNQIDFVSCSFVSIVENLWNLQTLCLDGCKLKDVRHIGNLKKLQILKISLPDIIELPKDVGQLTDLRLLDLRRCEKLQVIEHGVLRKLKRLEELYLDDCFDKWEVPHYKLGPSRRNASLDELNEMNWLSTLHVYAPNSTMLPENLKLEKLENYRILLGDVKNYSEENDKMRTFRLDLSDSTSILWEEGVKRLMHKTKSLYLKGMMRMPKPSIHQLCSQGFPCLNDLHLQNCDSVEYIVESSELVLAFPNLETLTLVNLKNLRKICNGRLMDESFGQLNAITVEKCHALESLFDISLMERIPSLKKIEVKDCKKMEGIVTDDIGHNGGTRKKIKWDQLSQLYLEKLEQIVGFYITDTAQKSSESNRLSSISEPTAFFNELISFPGLESLLLIRLPKVRKIWHQNIPLSELSKLQSLIVDGFEEASQLKCILFYSPNTTPQQESALQKLALGFNCLKAQVDHYSQIQSPQGLVTSEMGKKKDKKHIALQTKTLYPKGHPRGNSRHQNLRCLIVCDCETLKFLFTSSMVQALPHLTELTVAKCKMMKEVIQADTEDNGLKSVEFQELTTLCLESLENLITFSQGNISITFPSLKSLKIYDCYNLEALFTDYKDGETKEEILGSLFHAKVSPSFHSLDNLDICNMNKLRRIWQCQVYTHAILSQHGGLSGGSSPTVTASELWKTFLNIKKLHITDCDSLVKILDVEGSLDAEACDSDKCVDAQLNEVSLENLLNIEHVWERNDPTGRNIRYRYLQKVSLCKCHNIESIFPAPMTKDLLRLQSLEVTLCDKMKHLIGEESSFSGNNAPQFFFPDVKVLKLSMLGNLMTFYRGPHCSEWPSLEQLMVSKCDNFKIFGCEHKTSQASNKASQDSQTLFLVNKNSFCRLSTLELSQNQQMKQIWRGLYPMELFRKLRVLKLISSGEEPIIIPIKFLDKSPRLESLKLHHVPIIILKTPEAKGPLLRPIEQLVTKRCLHEMKLDMIPEMSDLKEALDSLLGASSYSFGWLTSLKVSNCHRLAYLFTYSTVKSLGCLTRLTIANCESMKVVVASEKGKVVGEVILEKLEFLMLDSLQGLTSFCEENYKFRFPYLEEVIVRDCSKIMMFTHGETISPNLTKMELKQKKIDLHDERNLNKIIVANKA